MELLHTSIWGNILSTSSQWDARSSDTVVGGLLLVNGHFMGMVCVCFFGRNVSSRDTFSWEFLVGDYLVRHVVIVYLVPGEAQFFRQRYLEVEHAIMPDGISWQNVSSRDTISQRRKKK